jgi:AraC family transcriptional regulator, transcriptional activator FtrA
MSKRSSQIAPKPHRVAILVSNGSNPFELSVATEVFGLRRPELGFQPYDVIVCAPTKEVALRDSVFRMRTDGSLADALTADTVIVPNRPDPLAGQPSKVLDTIRAAHQSGKRLVGFCTGSFSMGDAGILAGRTVATHWMWATAFRERFPDTTCDADRLFIDEGNLLTAAGSASALDLCLHIVRKDYGAVVAQRISRRLVFALHRDGGQQQFVERSVPTTAESGFGPLLDRLDSSLSEAHSVSSMAASVAMAPSTFHRRFASEVGMPPLTWLVRRRIDEACVLLENTLLSIEQIATAVGMGTSTNLRTHFTRTVGLTPSAYRASHVSR